MNIRRRRVKMKNGFKFNFGRNYKDLDKEVKEASKYTKYIKYFVIAVIAILVINGGFYNVSEQENAVVTMFGRVIRTDTAGLYTEPASGTRLTTTVRTSPMTTTGS